MLPKEDKAIEINSRVGCQTAVGDNGAYQRISSQSGRASRFCPLAWSPSAGAGRKMRPSSRKYQKHLKFSSYMHLCSSISKEFKDLQEHPN